MSDIFGVSRTFTPPDSGEVTENQREIGGQRVQVGGEDHRSHFPGRTGRKIASFVRAIGAAPQSLKQRIAAHKETKRANRAAAAALAQRAKSRAELLDRLPAGLGVSDGGVISGRAVASAIGTGDCPLTKDFAGKSVGEMIEYFSNGKTTAEKIAGEDVQVSQGGYADMGRLNNLVIGNYDSRAHAGKEQNARAAMAAAELHALIGDANQTALAIGVFSQNVPRLLLMAFKNDQGEALPYMQDNGGKTKTPHTYRNPDGEVERRIAEGLGDPVYTFSNFRDSKLDVKVCYNPSIISTKDYSTNNIPLPGMDGSSLLMKGEMNFTVDLTGEALKVVGEPQVTAVFEGHMAV
jgi:hypothetical protein